MARRIHAREMEYYNDSSEDEAILFEGDDSDDSDEVPTARGCTNPHVSFKITKRYCHHLY
jgi:hypothetical protein